MSSRFPGADRGPYSAAEAAAIAADPDTAPHRLQELAMDLPSTRPIVAANPSTPDFVLRFLATFHDTAIDAALDQNPSARRALASADPVDPAASGVDWADAPVVGAPIGLDAFEDGTVDAEPTGELPIVDDGSEDPAAEGGLAWPPPLLGAESGEDPETAAEPTPITAFLGSGGAAGVAAAAAARKKSSGMPRSSALILLPMLVILGVFAVVALATSLFSSGSDAPRRLGTARTVPTLPAPPLRTVPFGPTTVAGAASSSSASVAGPVASPDTTGAPTTTAIATDPVTASPATDAPDLVSGSATTLRPVVLPATVKPTTASPTSQPSTASQPVLSLDLADPSVQQAGSVAQQLVNAFAIGDWSTARRLQPGDITSNAQYEQAYANLHDGTVVLAKAISLGGGGYSVRLGIVAHQGFSGTKTTVLTCAHWNIDISVPSVKRVSSATVRSASGTLDADAVSAELRSACANAALA